MISQRTIETRITKFGVREALEAPMFVIDFGTKRSKVKVTRF